MSLTIQSPCNFNQKAHSIATFTRFQTAANNTSAGIQIANYDMENKSTPKEKVSAARAGMADGTNKAYSPEEWVKIRQAEEAIAHDLWFREQVEQGIKEADDPNTPWVSNEDANKSWAKQRAELAKRAGKA